MRTVKELEVGIFFWAEPDALQTVRNIKRSGVSIGQLGVDASAALDAAQWKAALEAEDFQLVTVFAAYDGESYADIPTVQRTVGFIPRATRAAREVRTLQVIDFAAALGVRSFGCHIGYVPEDRIDPDYEEVRDMVRRIADYAATHAITFCLETGQEPAPLLLRFFEDVARSNVRINFDPANMVLYGSGEPCEAFSLLARYVATVHAKDGDWPDPASPGSLGTERPLGQGSVDIPKFVQTLKSFGYHGTLHIESGLHGEEQRWSYLASAASYLRGLIG